MIKVTIIRIIMFLLIISLPIIYNYHTGVALAATMLIVILLAVGDIMIENIKYKQGQIDCFNGNFYYELKEFPDKTKKWIVKKKY
jgi:hypothetical protein